MLPQSSSQIYKSHFRGGEENENYRCLSTFNFGDYFDESRTPFGTLTTLNDETLAAQQTQSFSTEKNIHTLIIPLVGAVEYKDAFGNENYINTEEIQVSKSEAFQLQNPYKDELVNYLQIRFRSTQKEKTFFKKEFSLTNKNELFTLLENEDYKISIGIFDGRSEATYPLQNKKGAFAFVIAGAFEFQNRLLEPRDGLSLSGIPEIELEALSDHAILLLIETTLQD